MQRITVTRLVVGGYVLIALQLAQGLRAGVGFDLEPLLRRHSLLARRPWPVISPGLFMLIAVISFGGYWVP